tara:strand:- start:9 stop:182 length:174 start_codon:yes stop_codon:yes gene_type:complete
MNKKFSHTYNAGHWVGVGTAIGAVIFILTKEPLWIALGVVIGAAIDWKKTKIKNINN